MTKLYNHMFTLAFSMTTPKSCETCEPESNDYPTREEFAEAIAKRLKDIDRYEDGWLEAVGAPDDTYVEDEGDEQEIKFGVTFTVSGDFDRHEFQRRLVAAIEFGIGEGDNLTDEGEGYVTGYSVAQEVIP